MIFYFFLIIQEVETLENILCSYVLGSNLQKSKSEKASYISGNETFQPQS